MTYEQINSSIDEFNAALTTKYKLIATPKSKQSDRVRKAIWEYKEQETKDTKGKHIDNVLLMLVYLVLIACILCVAFVV